MDELLVLLYFLVQLISTFVVVGQGIMYLLQLKIWLIHQEAMEFINKVREGRFQYALAKRIGARTTLAFDENFEEASFIVKPG